MPKTNKNGSRPNRNRNAQLKDGRKYSQFPWICSQYHSTEKSISTNYTYNIKTVMSSRVQTEPLRSKIIPQCKRCQEYGHTHNFCDKTPRCVKCGKHFTRDCTKPTHEEPKCAHCGKNHPANYRGCEVYKDLRKFRNNSANSQAHPERPTRQINKRTTLSQSNESPEQATNINKSTAPNPTQRTWKIIKCHIFRNVSSRNSVT